MKGIKLKRFSCALLLAALLAALYGCLPRELAVRNFGPDFSPPGEDEALIFGKVLLSEKGVSAMPFGEQSGPLIFFMHVESERTSDGVRLARDGSFAAVVPRGTYLLKYLTYGYTIRPRAVFQAEGPGPYYVGDVDIDVLVRGDALMGTLIARSAKTRVLDWFDKTGVEFEANNPRYAGLSEKSLMVYDEAITTSDEFYTRSRLSGILDRLGMPIIQRYVPDSGRAGK